MAGWVGLSGLRILKPAAQPKPLRARNFQTKPTRQPKPNQPKLAGWVSLSRLAGWPEPLNTLTRNQEIYNKLNIMIVSIVSAQWKGQEINTFGHNPSLLKSQMERGKKH